MNKTYSLALHVFRRDLRLQDNTALISALQSAKQVMPCFIFDPRQIEKNDYKSDNCIQFMVNSLKELDERLKEKNSRLYYFYGIAEKVIQELLETYPIEALFINRDYTPFSLNRDKAIQQICQKKAVHFNCYSDALLHEPEQVSKNDQTPYTIFTPFFRKAQTLAVSAPKKNVYDNYYYLPIPIADRTSVNNLSLKNNVNLWLKGGREEGRKLLRKIIDLKDYKNIRDFPSVNGTSHLSAHNKFGTLSIREVYATIVSGFGKHHGLIQELYWRDFFTHIGFHFPHVFGSAFHKQYNHISWSQNTKKFASWCNGETGFPIVDAGMRELNTTGYMHNRVRMIVASFLTKDLHIDWRQGEKYFAQKLVDYDPAVNNGNWQWAASTGCDAQPYFRIFNPWLQQQKFDHDCLYIKKWVPELVPLPAKVIHALGKGKANLMTHYPPPIVDHAIQSQKAKLLYS